MNRPIRTPALLALLLLTGCVGAPSPSSSATPSPGSSVTPIESRTAAVTPSPAATATPQPVLSLELPPRRDDRKVRFSVAPKVDVDGDGTIAVTVENLGDSRINEIVLRWPTALDSVLFLAPFAPSDELVREGGPPLHFNWTRWVEGPGELGEPAGTTSVGWGPLLPHAKLSIGLVATRRGPGPVTFDFQLLSGIPHVAPVQPGGDALLSDPQGDPATTRVDVP
jgi:hypothetical protein